MSEWNPNYKTKEDESINEPEEENTVHKFRRIVLDSIMEVTPPEELAEMDPQERRKYCADMAASYSELGGNRTGRFFNAIAGAQGSGEADEKALGRRIMEKFNPHYRTKEK